MSDMELGSVLEHETEAADDSGNAARQRVADMVRSSGLLEGAGLKQAEELPAMEMVETLSAVRTDEQLRDAQAATSVSKTPAASKRSPEELIESPGFKHAMLAMGAVEVPPELTEA